MTKTILVTGASRGIGRDLAAQLSERGDQVIALVRNAESVRDLDCRVIVADLAAPQSLADAVAGIESLDVLIHNAGIAQAGPVAELSTQVWQQHLTVNVAAPAELTRVLLPALRASRGQVVFVNSGAGLSAGPQWSAYGAAKHGLKALADSLRAEERANSVRVTTVYPGIVDTDMQRELRESLGGPYDPQRAMRPGTVAAAIIGAIDMPADAVIQDLRIVPPNPLPHPTVKAK